MSPLEKAAEAARLATIEHLCEYLSDDEAHAIARAVLLAIREATNEQWVAGSDALKSEHGCLFNAYSAMINVLLRERK